MSPLSRPALSRRLSPSLLMAIVLLAGACGPGVEDALDGSASTDPGAVESSVPNVTPDPAAPDPQPAGVTADGRTVVSHLDVAQARFELNGAMERWAAAGPASYGLALTLSCECDQLSAESVVVDGASISSAFAFDVEAGFTPVVPVTVEELFAIADGFVSRLEQNPEAVAKGECDGATLALELDAVSGFPYRVSDDTPCDGGMAWSATLDLMTETAPDRASPEGFEPVSLDQPEIVPAGVDGLVVVTAHGFVAGDIEELFRNEFGTPCSSASDPGECAAAVDALVIDPIASAVFEYQCPMCLGSFVAIAATVGNEVFLVDGENLLDVLGAIDTPTEAVLVAGSTGVVRNVDGEWEILTSRVVADCDPIIERGALVRVPADGRFYETDHWYTKLDGVCI